MLNFVGRLIQSIVLVIIDPKTALYIYLDRILWTETHVVLAFAVVGWRILVVCLIDLVNSAQLDES